MRKVLTNRIFIIGFITMIVLLIILTLFDYDVRNQRRLQRSVIQITEENNQQVSLVTAKKLQDVTSVLKTYAAVISRQENIVDDTNLQLLQIINKKDSFLNLVITTADGMTTTSNHRQYDASQEAYFKEGMKGEPYISTPLATNSKEKNAIAISVPIYQEDAIQGVLSTIIDLQNIIEYLDIPFLSGAVTTLVVQADGEILTPNAQLAYMNYMQLLKDHKQQGALEKIEQDFQQGKTGAITFQLQDGHRFACYSPIDHSNWYILSIIPQSLIDQQMNANLQDTSIFSFKLAAILLLIGIYLLYLQRLRSREWKEVNKKLDAIIANTPGFSFRYELQNLNDFVVLNNEQCNLTGYTSEELRDIITKDLLKILYEEDYPNLMKQLYGNIQLHTTNKYTYRIRHKDGHLVWVYDYRHIIEENGKKYFYVTLIDITEMKTTQEKLLISEGRYKMILEETHSVAYEWDIAKDMITFSDLWNTYYGYPTQIQDFLLVCDAFYRQDNSFVPLIESMIQGKESDKIECLLPKADGTKIWCRIVARAVLDKDGFLLRIVGSIADITEQKKQTIQLKEKSQKDGLTKALNRITIEEAIEHVILSSPDKVHYLMVIDIDNFKYINDTFGHICGDEALRKIAETIQTCFRSMDLIGRIGGDEFVVFMRDIENEQKDFIDTKAKALLQALHTIRLTTAPEHRITCSIGIAKYPDIGLTYQKLFYEADKALYKSKQNGKNGYHVVMEESQSL